MRTQFEDEEYIPGIFYNNTTEPESIFNSMIILPAESALDRLFKS